jgi:short-subunit dehydrogenase
MKLSGSLCVVSGASSGIGAAAARKLAAEGARVVLVARTEAKLREVAEGLDAVVVPADLADPSDARSAGERILALGVPDLVVHSAGAGRWLAVDETPYDEAITMIGAPYLSAFLLTRALLPAMLARGSGVILAVNSPASRAVWPGATGYAASRHALRAFCDGLRADVRGTGLSVAEVVLGEVSSPYFDTNEGARERLPRIARLLPVLTPDEAADVVLDAARREPAVLVRPRLLGALVLLNQHAPGLVRVALEATGWRRP